MQPGSCTSLEAGRAQPLLALQTCDGSFASGGLPHAPGGRACRRGAPPPPKLPYSSVLRCPVDVEALRLFAEDPEWARSTWRRGAREWRNDVLAEIVLRRMLSGAVVDVYREAQGCQQRGFKGREVSGASAEHEDAESLQRELERGVPLGFSGLSVATFKKTFRAVALPGFHEADPMCSWLVAIAEVARDEGLDIAELQPFLGRDPAAARVSLLQGASLSASDGKLLVQVVVGGGGASKCRELKGRWTQRLAVLRDGVLRVEEHAWALSKARRSLHAAKARPARSMLIERAREDKKELVLREFGADVVAKLGDGQCPGGAVDCERLKVWRAEFRPSFPRRRSRQCSVFGTQLRMTVGYVDPGSADRLRAAVQACWDRFGIAVSLRSAQRSAPRTVSSGQGRS